MKALRSLAALCFISLLAGCGGSSSSTAPSGGGGGGGGNHAPTVNVNTSTTHLAYSGTATISVTASDADGDQVTLAYTATGGTVSASGPTATTATFTAGRSFGPCAVTVSATDGKGGSVQAVASMYIRNPNKPALAIEAVGTTACGGSSFQVRVTSPEPLIVTNFTTHPQTAGTACPGVSWYYSPAISLLADTPYTFVGPGGRVGCAGNTGCEPYWEVGIVGTRPEPDGGSFGWSIVDWSP